MPKVYVDHNKENIDNKGGNNILGLEDIDSLIQRHARLSENRNTSTAHNNTNSGPPTTSTNHNNNVATPLATRYGSRGRIRDPSPAPSRPILQNIQNIQPIGIVIYKYM